VLILLSSVGNDILHMLTSVPHRRQVLRIELEDWKGDRSYAEYDDFKVGSEAENYKLTSLGKYSGSAG